MQNTSFFRIVAISWFFISLAFVYLPILTMIFFSMYNPDPSASGIMQNFTSEWYVKFFEAEDMVAALSGSLFVGFLATMFNIILTLGLVVGSKYWNPFWMMKSFAINTALPEIFMAVIVLSVFVVMGVQTGIISLVVGHTLLGLGYAVPMIYPAFLSIEPALLESSLDLGATHFQTFRYVLLPILKPDLIAAAFIVFTLSMDDFFINFFCSGVGFQTVSTFVYTAIRAHIDPSLNAMSSTLFFLSFFLVILVALPKSLDKVFSDE